MRSINVNGIDGSSTWELRASTNSGGSYSKIGNTVGTTSTTLTNATFTVNSPNAIRFSLRKVSGGANRVMYKGETR